MVRGRDGAAVAAAGREPRTGSQGRHALVVLRGTVARRAGLCLHETQIVRRLMEVVSVIFVCVRVALAF